jgi:hypothetical protein
MVQILKCFCYPMNLKMMYVPGTALVTRQMIGLGRWNHIRTGAISEAFLVSVGTKIAEEKVKVRNSLVPWKIRSLVLFLKVAQGLYLN